MTLLLNNSELAVIGDDVLVNGLRLAGIQRCFTMTAQSELEIKDEVQKVVGRLLEERSISIVVILDKYVQYVQDLLDRFRQSKRLTPVIIEIPAVRDIDYDAVKEHYKRFVRKYIGFDLEIQSAGGI
jgi:vacuolar-type H+-ATPase subunit F/Vma7